MNFGQQSPFGFGSSPVAGGGGSEVDFFTVTKAQLDTLVGTSALQPGSFYKITDRGDLGILVQATSANTVSLNGVRYMLCPVNYTPGDTINAQTSIGVWNETLTVSNGNIAIWGGKFWENTTGNIGTADDPTTLNATDWTVIAKAAGPYYTEIQMGVLYDYGNDWIERQWDANDNIFGVPFSESGNFFENPVDTSDWNYSSFTDDFGHIGFSSNVCAGIFNNVVESNVFAAISNNKIRGDIQHNRTTYGIFNNTNNGSIQDNVTGELPSQEGINNNSNQGDITFNTCGRSISFNSNAGSIGDNTIEEYISNNSNIGVIESNTVGRIEQNSNLGQIQGNTFSGQLASNSNLGQIRLNTCFAVTNNSNNGEITSNANTGGVQGNSNNGIIQGCTSNVTDVFTNDNNSLILDNDNVGAITGNKNNGGISLNESTVTDILQNVNNGGIFQNSASVGTISITTNTNNGDINGSFGADVTDPVVNKP